MDERVESMREMQIKIKKQVLYNVSWKQLLYMLCFFFLCVLDQRVMTGRPNDGSREIFRNLTGICMAAIILSHYTWKDIVKYKVYYLGWSVLAAIGLPIFYTTQRSWQPLLRMWMTVLFLILIWGYVLLATGISFFIEKRRPGLQKKIFAVWLLMMFLMIVSRSDLIWPECYFIMFGCFYLTDFSEEERKFLLEGALHGIILAFIAVQGFGCLFRPYEEVRYKGTYANCNNNALFYLIVLSAALTKLYDAKNRQSNKWLQLYYFWGISIVLSFLIMTIGRAAWIATIAMLIFFIRFLYGAEWKRVWLKKGLILALCVCLTFPFCFAVARYIQPLLHHPVYFWDDPNLQERARTGNLEIYVELDDFLSAAFGRVSESINLVIDHLFPTLKTAAAQAVPGTFGHPILDDSKSGDYIAIRSTIYRHFWENLNWRGHIKSEIGLQLLPSYWVEHAHNIFLQFGTDFGIPVMILFAVMLIWPLVICKRRLEVKKNASYMGSFMWLLIPLTFGMFELAWAVGTMSVFMMFFAWRDVFWEEI